jgi:DNA (cytosine-5)-methyltransferase 1
MSHLFPYCWKLSDGYPAKGIKHHGRKVFGTFICGGGSTMGYKLAGFDHLGGVEIDPKVAAVYKANHKPKHLYVEDIRAFNERTDLPDELFNLDLLDGSPPCSSFSMAGSREKGWGKEKVFREGQAHQRLDDLVFTYVDTIAKLRPKVAILENVKGLLAGNAKVYAKEIVKRLRGHGYTVQVFLLNAATMGVPQMRERCFFIARLDSSWPNLVLEFKEPPIPFSAVYQSGDQRKQLSESNARRWKTTRIGHQPKTKNGSFGFLMRIDHAKVAPTLLSGNTFIGMRDEPKDASPTEYKLIGSYPVDYDFGSVPQKHLIGMSVPPVMTAQIAHQINRQWFNLSSV